LRGEVAGPGLCVQPAPTLYLHFDSAIFSGGLLVTVVDALEPLDPWFLKMADMLAR
jgi:hypothetical protein